MLEPRAAPRSQGRPSVALLGWRVPVLRGPLDSQDGLPGAGEEGAGPEPTQTAGSSDSAVSEMTG